MRKNEIEANKKRIDIFTKQYFKLMELAFKENFFENVSRANGLLCEIYILKRKNKNLKRGMPELGYKELHSDKIITK